MSWLSILSGKKGGKKNKTRVGRGIGSGKGKTCGRGHKGQKSRKGVSLNNYEGGQTPFYKRVPTKGFGNKAFTKNYHTLTLKQLQKLVDDKVLKATAVISVESLVDAKVVKTKRDGLKVISGGEVKSALKLKVVKITGTAKEAIEKAGGKVDVIEPKEKVRKLPKKEGKKESLSRVEKKKAKK